MDVEEGGCRGYGSGGGGGSCDKCGESGQFVRDCFKSGRRFGKLELLKLWGV